ncbi:hypothetical protein QC762_606740 [Podospora pseudocomata]|uniref:Uncharacterized protein n=1 Tax=Podospora pseudocomata TaxID=2093779 RepID=A0ABR0G835_9PEZI|nr:hypothetical protein QC762_606740 [Podospora pseudocomata]
MSENIPNRLWLMTPARRSALETSCPNLLAAFDAGFLHIATIHHQSTSELQDLVPYTENGSETIAIFLYNHDAYFSHDTGDASLMLVAAPGFMLHATIRDGAIHPQPRLDPSLSIGAVCRTIDFGDCGAACVIVDRNGLNELPCELVEIAVLDLRPGTRGRTWRRALAARLSLRARGRTRRGGRTRRRIMAARLRTLAARLSRPA